VSRAGGSNVGGWGEEEDDEWEDVAAGGTQDDDDEIKVKVKKEKQEEATMQVPIPIGGSGGGGGGGGGDIHIFETPDNAVVLGELRGLCRTAAGRLVPALGAALALLSNIRPALPPAPPAAPMDRAPAAAALDGAEEETSPSLLSGDSALSAEARAAAVNALDGAKRDLVAALDRCRALGIAAAAPPPDPPHGANEGINVDSDDDQHTAAVDDGDGGYTVVLGEGLPPVEDVEPAAVGDEDLGNVPDNETLDALLERAARRQRLRRGGGGGGAGGGRFGSGAGQGGHDGGGGGGGASAGRGGAQSMENRARRILSSQVTAHNTAVMSELGSAGVDRRNVQSGAAEQSQQRQQQQSNEAAARLMAEEEERDAKRRKESATPRQRIDAKLKALGNKRKR